MTLEVSAIIDVILLLGACIFAILMLYAKSYPRMLLNFTAIVICLLLFCIHRFALIIGFILLWCYAGAVIAYAACFLNIAGSVETVGRIRSAIVILIIYLVLSVLIVSLLPPQELSAPVQISVTDFAKGLWSVNAFLVFLLSLLVFISIASALMIAIFSLKSE